MKAKLVIWLRELKILLLQRLATQLSLLMTVKVINLEGFKEIQPQVFAGLFPINSDDYKDFRDALEKLELNDSSFDYEPLNI